MPYSGVASGAEGKPLSGEVGITFLIFKEAQGGEPLWVETQSILLDNAGHYKAQLGATSANGIPLDLFSTGEARWLEVQVAGQAPTARVLLASVPYALKAGDASTLGGLPASAFALAGAKSSEGVAAVAPSGVSPDLGSTVTTTGGTSGHLAVFNGAATIANSEIVDTGTSVGLGDSPNPAAKLDVNGETILRGSVQLSRTGNATPLSGANSYGFGFYAQGYDSSTKANVNPNFLWQGEITGNDTASPGATMNLLYSDGIHSIHETGLYFNGVDGTIHFAPGQTFPGTGSGTISGVTAGTDLTGGGTAGNVTLNLDTSKIITGLTAGTGLTGGGTTGNVTLSVDPLRYRCLASAILSWRLISLPVMWGSGLGRSGTNYTPLTLASNSTFGTWLVLGNTSSSPNGSGHVWNILSAGPANSEGAGSLSVTDFTGTSNIFLKGNVLATSGNFSQGLQTGGPSTLNGPVSINGDLAMTQNPRMTFSGFLMGNLGQRRMAGSSIPTRTS